MSDTPQMAVFDEQIRQKSKAMLESGKRVSDVVKYASTALFEKACTLERELVAAQSALKICGEALNQDVLWGFDCENAPVTLTTAYPSGGSLTSGPNNCQAFYVARKKALSLPAVKQAMEK